MSNEVEIEEMELNDDEKELLKGLLSADSDDLSESGAARRDFLKQMSATSIAILATQVLDTQKILAYSADEIAVGGKSIGKIGRAHV